MSKCGAAKNVLKSVLPVGIRELAVVVMGGGDHSDEQAAVDETGGHRALRLGPRSPTA
jgi:hypothetical protein